MATLPFLLQYIPMARTLVARRRTRDRMRLDLWEWEGGSTRPPSALRDLETTTALRDATHPEAVIAVVMHAIDGIRRASPDDASRRFTPSRLASRADVEHWARRMAAPGTLGRPAQKDLLALLHAALLRFDEIGPARARNDA